MFVSFSFTLIYDFNLLIRLSRDQKHATSGPSNYFIFCLSSDIVVQYTMGVQLGRVESKLVTKFDTRLPHCISGINTCGQVLVSSFFFFFEQRNCI